MSAAKPISGDELARDLLTDSFLYRTSSSCAGICYGFQAMRLRESPNTPFTLQTTAPTTIVYDNCCNLHNYCLNREPDFFKETKFLVDRFHWSNHTGKHFNTAHNYYT